MGSSFALFDTPDAVETLMVERWRALSVGDRWERITELNDSCQRMAEAGVRLRYPLADAGEVRLRVLALRLGRDLMVDVYGWDPDLEGW